VAGRPDDDASASAVAPGLSISAKPGLVPGFAISAGFPLCPAFSFLQVGLRTDSFALPSHANALRDAEGLLSRAKFLFNGRKAG